jgi:hypothetical protein
VLRNENVKCVTKVEFYTGRFIFLKISAMKVGIVILQVYMPTTVQDDEIVKMYEISDLLHQEGRSQVNAIVMGDFSSIL